MRLVGVGVIDYRVGMLMKVLLTCQVGVGVG